jgi:bacteriorhodopsin
VGFVLGLCGWFYILYEIFAGEAGQVATSGAGVNSHVQASFNTMRFIVSVGWSIYPLGYFLGYLTGAVAEAPLNCVYNLADLVNKIGFCLAIWSCAKASTEEIKAGIQVQVNRASNVEDYALAKKLKASMDTV